MLSNPQVTHGMVCQGLAGPTATGRTLWRFEYDPRRAHLIVLTQSKPSWAHIVEAAGWEEADGAEARVVSLDPLVDLVALGRRFSFRVRVNPSSSTQAPNGAPARTKLVEARSAQGGRVRGARVAERSAAQQTGWFLKRTAHWGFAVPLIDSAPDDDGPHDMILDERRTVTFTKRNVQRNRVTLSTATFTGNLIVTNPQRFTESLIQGIGRGKAYGCGLITLGPPSGIGHHG
jgi:CRISPR system Cascade subunit CasE